MKIKTGSVQMKINQENMNKIPVIDIPDRLKELIDDQTPLNPDELKTKSKCREGYEKDKLVSR